MTDLKHFVISYIFLKSLTIVSFFRIFQREKLAAQTLKSHWWSLWEPWSIDCVRKEGATYRWAFKKILNENVWNCLFTDMKINIPETKPNWNESYSCLIVCGVFTSQTVVQVKKLILDGAGSAQGESEVQMYLLALKNSLLPEAIPIFTKYSESEVGAYNTIALTALQRYDVNLMTDEVSHNVHNTSVIYEWCVELIGICIENQHLISLIG